MSFIGDVTVGRKKLWRLAELEEFDNLIQFTDQPKQDDFRFHGSWAKDYFKNNNPITLELACGKGDYTIALAEKYPDKNFIGIDFIHKNKGSRFSPEKINEYVGIWRDLQDQSAISRISEELIK